MGGNARSETATKRGTDSILEVPTAAEPESGRLTTGLPALSAVFVLSAVVFFPLIMNPVVFGFFDAESDGERLDHVEANLGALRLIFTGIGLTEIALGVALWLWGRTVASRTAGRRGEIAKSLAWVALTAGVVALLMRLTVWLDDAEALASDDLSATDIVLGLVGGGGFSVSLLGFGYLMIRGEMPTWLGVVWVVCGVLFWLGILPLWFFVAALVFGVHGLIRFRPGGSAPAAVSAAPVS